MEQALQALLLGVESIASSTMHIWVKQVCVVLHLGQTYLMFCCSSLAGQNFFVSKKKKKKLITIDLMYTYTWQPWLCYRWLVCDSAWKSFQGTLCHSGPESLTDILLSRLEKDQSESQVFTGHPGLLCDWASLSNKTISGSGLKRGFALDLANVASLTSYTMFTAHSSFG